MHWSHLINLFLTSSILLVHCFQIPPLHWCCLELSPCSDWVHLISLKQFHQRCLIIPILFCLVLLLTPWNLFWSCFCIRLRHHRVLIFSYSSDCHLIVIHSFSPWFYEVTLQLAKIFKKSNKLLMYFQNEKKNEINYFWLILFDSLNLLDFLMTNKL